jgi:hypothetical protein
VLLNLENMSINLSHEDLLEAARHAYAGDLSLLLSATVGRVIQVKPPVHRTWLPSATSISFLAIFSACLY